jgi:hypothetical protein
VNTRVAPVDQYGTDMLEIEIAADNREVAFSNAQKSTIVIDVAFLEESSKTSKIVLMSYCEILKWYRKDFVVVYWVEAAPDLEIHKL